MLYLHVKHTETCRSFGGWVRRPIGTSEPGNGDFFGPAQNLGGPVDRRRLLVPHKGAKLLYLTDDDLGLKLNGFRSFHDVTARSFDQLARRAGWTEQAARARVREAVERVTGAWSVLTDRLLTGSSRRLIRHRDALPLVRGG